MGRFVRCHFVTVTTKNIKISYYMTDLASLFVLIRPDLLEHLLLQQTSDSDTIK
jgi:hypothetical protein